MTNDQALDMISKLLAPRKLSYIEQSIFLASWSGKLYREISDTTGYEFGYVKDVGSQLWLSLSEAIGRPVTKKNLHVVLSDWIAPQSQKGQNLKEKLLFGAIEFTDRAIPARSSLYLERPPIEEIARAAIAQPGSLLRVRAPRRMGKTSLLNQLLDEAKHREISTVTIDFQQADREIFMNLNRFLRWLSWNVSQQLHLKPKLDEYWFEEVGSKVSCTTYFQEYVLKQMQCPILLAFDEVNRLFEYPALARDFLPMLRNWHDQTSTLWQKLRLVLVYSTEIYVSLNLHQSPFNVGLSLALTEFTRSQVQDLAQHYQLNENWDALYHLVGGHPYLLQRAFSALRAQQTSYDQLLQNAPTISGVYKDHLRQLWFMLQNAPNLYAVFQQVVAASNGVSLDASPAYLLEGMGLVKLQGNSAIVRCQLYQQYFQAQYHL